MTREYLPTGATRPLCSPPAGLCSPGPAGSVWQPIDTAPKDGTRILLWNEIWEAPSTGQYYFEGWRIDFSVPPFKYQPTHWMQLPDTPNIV